MVIWFVPFTADVGYYLFIYLQTWEFSRLESWSRDVSRPVFTSLGLGLGLGT